MTDATKEEIVKLAQDAAQLFQREFDESLDPDETDWDAVAWQDDRNGLGLTEADMDKAWPIYQAALVAETERLCGV